MADVPARTRVHIIDVARLEAEGLDTIEGQTCRGWVGAQVPEPIALVAVAIMGVLALTAIGVADVADGAIQLGVATAVVLTRIGFDIAALTRLAVEVVIATHATAVRGGIAVLLEVALVGGETLNVLALLKNAGLTILTVAIVDTDKAGSPGDTARHNQGQPNELNELRHHHSPPVASSWQKVA